MENQFAFPAIIGAGVYDSSFYRRSGVTRSRTVAFYELEYVLEGSGRLILDGVEHVIRPGLVVLTKPGQRRSTELPYRCRFLHIAPCDSPFCRELDRLPDTILLDSDEFRELFERATEAPLPHGVPLKPEGEALELYAALLELTAQISRRNRSASDKTDLPPAILRVISYIDTHPAKLPRLDELAETVHLSPIYLHRLFKRTLGTTPYRFVLERKLTLAKNLLLSTRMSCQEIALELGFASASYFTATFRREVGVSPSEFRRTAKFEI